MISRVDTSRVVLMANLVVDIRGRCVPESACVVYVNAKGGTKRKESVWGEWNSARFATSLREHNCVYLQF